MKTIYLLIFILVLTQSFSLTDITNAITDATSSATTSASSAVDSITSSTSSIIDSTTATLNTALQTIKNTVGNAVNATQSAIDSAVTKMQHEVNYVIDQTSQAIDSAVQTVKNTADEVMNKINSFSSEMCETQCTSFFNLPCFILFGCSSKLRNFFLILVLPIILVVVMIIGCGTGLFTIPCFIKAFGIVTGILPAIWLVQKCRKSKKNSDAQDAQVKPKIQDQIDTSKHIASNNM